MSSPLKTVVVAEDEALIRMLIADLLVNAGFLVVQTSHAAEAMAALDERAAEVAFLFSDIHMPGPMNGLELAHHVRRHWPWIALLIASGKPSSVTSDLPSGSCLLPSPMTPNTFSLTHSD